MCWHMAMTRKEVLVQLDELVARLDDLSARSKVSRLELLRRGALAILEAEDLARADDALQAAYRRQPPDPLLLDCSTARPRDDT